MDFIDAAAVEAATKAQETDEGGSQRRPGAAQIEQAVRTLIASTGDDPRREGLRNTQTRVARAYLEWFSGYPVDPREFLQRQSIEAQDYEETIVLRDIPLVPTCEHHLAPILGHAHVGYRPRHRIVGISKLSRLTNAFARRLQLQERLTRQIATTLEDVLQPRGVAGVIEASHGCMTTRGVNQHGVSLVTECWLGDFRNDADLRRALIQTVHRYRSR